MRHHIWLFAVVAAVIAATWWWLGRPVPLAGGDPGRIPCVSYAPFRGDQSPLVATTQVSAAAIREDLTNLARVTGCVRTYSIENGLDQVPQIAEQLGISVIQGLWLSSNRVKNRAQIDATIALARQYPAVISAVVVGNEVLLRGELSAEEILAALREVKAAVPMPVTYADVWEYWLRNRELVGAVDFVTVHILPYWEDDPISADRAGAHVDEIRARVAASFPGKDILIGEVGWPSAGRMREGALPSRSNQARVLAEVASRALAGHYRVNFIEAFDQPWKRQLEGTVGGAWGLFANDTREPKFAWGRPVSDHPDWVLGAGLGVVLAAAIFAAALWAGGHGGAAQSVSGIKWFGIAAMAAMAGITAPWGFESVAVESLGPGGWARGIWLAAVAVASPVWVAALIGQNLGMPDFNAMLGPAAERPTQPAAWGAGVLRVLVTVLALQTALGLVFDPRYRDFAFAPLTAAVLPFGVAAALPGFSTRWTGALGFIAHTARAELMAAATLAAASFYIVLDEGFQNWQALWFAGIILLLAVSLVRWRRPDAQGT